MSNKVKAILCLVILLMTEPLSAAQNQSLTQQGMVAFKRGEYREALDYFKKAEKGGDRSESTQYNIAVSLYRLQHFEEAQLRFIKLSKIPKWRDLAHYNLGLVAEVAGDDAGAGKWYGLAVHSEHEQLRLLAGRKLQNLAKKKQPSTAAVRNWMALFSFSRGQDSNAASLADELVQSAGRAQDSYHEWLVYTQAYLSGHAGDGVKFYVLGFDRRYDDMKSLDSRVTGLGLLKQTPWRGSAAEAGIRLTQTQVDSELLANQLQAKLGISRVLEAGTLSLAYLPSRYFAGDRYSQIDGWQHRLEAGWARRFDVFSIKARYRFETNDRDDLRRSGSFSSYSPQRNSIMGQLDRKLSDSVNLGFALEYTRSEYSGENRMRDTDGVFKQAARSSEQIRYAANLGYRWSKHWRLKGEYEYTDTKDNFSLYTYDKNRLNAAVEFQF
jgi:hypothetical protein